MFAGARAVFLAAILTFTVLILSASTATAATPNCTTVSTLIKSAVGFAEPAPKVLHFRHTVDCSYAKLGRRGHTVLVRFTTGASRATLAADRRSLDVGKQRAKTFGGLGSPAFSSVLPRGLSSTLVVLKGRTELLVTISAPLAKTAALVRKLLPAL